MTWPGRLIQAIETEYGDRGAVAVLATVTPTGEPAARCVICRRVSGDGVLVFTTDLRSEKIDHLRNQPAAEVLFWLPAIKTQYRIAGDIQIITGRAAAGEWAGLPDPTRQTFFAPPPGEPFSEPSIPADLSAPPATFAVLQLVPDKAESLDLTTVPHTRLRWMRASDWREQRINP